VVVCNVSRRVVTEARAVRAPVSVVEITAPPAILAQRLANRGRPEDGDLAARLAREATVEADLTILNIGAPLDAAEQLVAHLRAC
jgi:ribose 1,5-bisphosphokinase